MAETIGSSALSTASPVGSSAATSSDFARPMASREPNSPTWALPTLSTMPMWGRAMPVRYSMCPTPRAPISTTRKRVSGVTRQTVSGTPTSLLSEPTGATVGAADARTLASRSLVLVLPEEPVMPMTVSSPCAAMTPRARAAKPSCTSSTTTQGSSSTLRVVSAATAPLERASPTNWWPSMVSPTRAT
jgi:hypothetical protein